MHAEMWNQTVRGLGTEVCRAARYKGSVGEVEKRHTLCAKKKPQAGNYPGLRLFVFAYSLSGKHNYVLNN